MVLQLKSVKTDIKGKKHANKLRLNQGSNLFYVNASTLVFLLLHPKTCSLYTMEKIKI